MNRRTNLYPAFGSQDRGQPQHLRSVALHWKISQTPGIHVRPGMNPPPEDGLQLTGQHALHFHEIGPFPELTKRFPVHGHKFPAFAERHVQLPSQALFAETVKHAERHGFELLTLRGMRLFRGVSRNRAGHLRERQVEVSRRIGFLHALVARQAGRYRQLLLGPIAVGYCFAGSRLDETSQPG